MEQLSDHAMVLLTFMREAGRSDAAITTEIMEVLYKALGVTHEEIMAVNEVFKADLRESAATKGFLGTVNDLIRDIERGEPTGE